MRGVYDQGYAFYVDTYAALAPLYARRAGSDCRRSVS
jgi:hypothetical protein